MDVLQRRRHRDLFVPHQRFVGVPKLYLVPIHVLYIPSYFIQNIDCCRYHLNDPEPMKEDRAMPQKENERKRRLLSLVNGIKILVKWTKTYF